MISLHPDAALSSAGIDTAPARRITAARLRPSGSREPTGDARRLAAHQLRRSARRAGPRATQIDGASGLLRLLARGEGDRRPWQSGKSNGRRWHGDATRRERGGEHGGAGRRGEGSHAEPNQIIMAATVAGRHGERNRICDENIIKINR